jgi:hypothetical protein
VVAFRAVSVNGLTRKPFFDIIDKKQGEEDVAHLHGKANQMSEDFKIKNGIMQ